MRCIPYGSIKDAAERYFIWRIRASGKEHSFNDQASYLSSNGLRSWYNNDFRERGYGKPVLITYDSKRIVIDVDFEPQNISKKDIHPDYKDLWKIHKKRRNRR